MDDLRTPSGLFFLLTGLIVLGVGIFAPGETAPLADASVNVYSGAAMIVFGGFLLLLAWRAARHSTHS